MSFLRGFLTGAARQYNANVAAQKAEDAEMDKIDREYGYRKKIEDERNRAAALLKEDEFENDMFLKGIEAENSERLKRIEGEEDRKTEELKARLEGKGPVMSFSLGKTDPKGKPITLPVPTFEGKTQDAITAKEFVWLNTNGLKYFEQLNEENPAELPKFRAWVSDLWLRRTAMDDVATINPNNGDRAVTDILPMFTGVAQLIDKDPQLKGSMSKTVSELDQRIRRAVGMPEGDEPSIIPVQTPASATGKTDVLSYSNYPDWMKGQDGKVDMGLYKNVQDMVRVTGNKDVRGAFITFMEQSFPGNQDLKVKYEQFVKLDNSLSPTNGFDYELIPEESFNNAAIQLRDMRYESPENLHKYLTFVAMNDENPLSATYTPGKMGITAKQAKDMFDIDVADANNKVRANERVVRMTTGVMRSISRGGKPGIAGKMELFVNGVTSNMKDIKEAGTEVIGLITNLDKQGIYAGNTQQERDVNRKARQENLQLLREVQGRIDRNLNVDQTALLLYYSTLLAYAGAVAVQGGDAAARTVSDQDVQRVATGIAPAAENNFVSIDQLVAVTETFGGESREQAVIYGGFSTEGGRTLNRVSMKASFLFNKLYGKDPFDFREYLRANTGGVYDQVFEGQSPVNDSTKITGTSDGAKAGLQYFMRKRAEKSANPPVSPLQPAYPTNPQVR